MRERTCAYCGKTIKGLFVEMTVNKLSNRQTSMEKVDLHPECFTEVWSKAHKAEGEDDE